MYARFIRVEVPVENFDGVLAATKERNVPMVTQFPGFRAGFWAGDRATGTFATCVVFDSGEGIRAAEGGMEQMRPMAEPLGVRFLSVENLEVFVHEEAR